jgi:hypothetical protein
VPTTSLELQSNLLSHCESKFHDHWCGAFAKLSCEPLGHVRKQSFRLLPQSKHGVRLEMITIRAEVPDDVAAIHDVNRAAFGQEAEAHLVDRLRALGNLTCTVTYPDVFKLVD